MKRTLLPFLILAGGLGFLAAPTVHAAAAANDLILSQRNAGNTRPVERLLTPSANSLFGFNGSLLPAPVTIGSGLQLVSGVLSATGGGGGGTWGSITGTLSSQTDLQTALDAKLATTTLNGFFADPSTNGSFSASAWRTDLALVVGTNVQAFSSNLSTYAGIAPSANVQSLLGAANYAAMRAQLDLEAGTDFLAYPSGTPTGSKFLRDDNSWQTISGGGDALTGSPLSQFASTTSAQLRGVLSDESGTGVFLTDNGSGANLTALNASNLGSGTVPDARFPATLPALNGSALTALNGSAIASGTVADARIAATITRNADFDTVAERTALGFKSTTAGSPEEIEDHGNMGATETFNLATANVHRGVLDANLTLTLSGFTSGKFCSGTAALTQDATGSRTITWPAAVVGTTTLNPAANSITFVAFWSWDGGTTIYAQSDYSTAGTGAINASVDVAALATGGSGTSASPWTGWVSVLNASWASNTNYFFRRGYYAGTASGTSGGLVIYSTSAAPLNNIRLVGEQGTILMLPGAVAASGTGDRCPAGVALAIVSNDESTSSFTNTANRISIENMRIYGSATPTGTATATDILLYRNAHWCSTENVSVSRFTGAGMRQYFAIASKHTNFEANGYLDGLTAATNGLVMEADPLNTAIWPSASYFTNLYVALCSGDGIRINKTWLSNFSGGASESNGGYGLYCAVGATKTAFTGMDFEGNGATKDAFIKGEFLSFYNCTFQNAPTVLSGTLGGADAGSHTVKIETNGQILYGVGSGFSPTADGILHFTTENSGVNRTAGFRVTSLTGGTLGSSGFVADLAGYNLSDSASGDLVITAPSTLQTTGAGFPANTAADRDVRFGAWGRATTLRVRHNDVLVSSDLNVGHASDTTITRASAGDIAVEGNRVFRVGGSFAGLPETWVVPIGDETTAITTGTAKVTWRAPYACTVTAVRASLTTVSSSGTPTFDINEGGTTILSTKLTIDASEKTSTTAATAAVISDTTLADDAELTIDVDVAGTSAAGAKITIYVTRN